MYGMLIMALFTLSFIAVLWLLAERKLFIMMLFALCAHFILILAIHIDLNRYSEPNVLNSKFFNDGEAYSSNAFIISQVLRDEKIDESFFARNRGIQLCGLETLKAAKKGQLINPHTYEVGYIAYLYAVIYAAYGYCPALINLINVIIILASSLIVFKIARDIYGRRTAYLTTTFFIFNPVLFYYSNTKLKESLSIFLFYLLILICVTSVRKKNILFLFLSLPLLVFIRLFKQHYLPPAILFLILIFFWQMFLRNKKMIIFALIGSAGILLLRAGNLKQAIITQLQNAAGYHYGNFTSGGRVYPLLKERNEFLHYGWHEWLAYSINGWSHFLFEPLSFSGFSFVSFLKLYIYKIIFLFLFAFSIFGLIISFRRNYRYDVVFILFYLIFGSLLALTEANVMTMFRHRDLVSVITFIYAAVFISSFIKNGLSFRPRNSDAL